jgi:hypothetical protein
MKLKMVVGVGIFAVGVAMAPFGWWVARIYYYGGLLLALVGALLAFSAHRMRPRDSDTWAPGDDSIVPPAGEARGFKGRDIFGESHASDSSDASTD